MGNTGRTFGRFFCLAAAVVILGGLFSHAIAQEKLPPTKEGLIAFKDMLSSDTSLQGVFLGGSKDEILKTLATYFDLSQRPALMKRLEAMPEERLQELAAAFVNAPDLKTFRAQKRSLLRPNGRTADSRS